MEAERRSRITFYLIMLLLAYLAFILIKPYFGFVVLALIFAYIFNPLYKVFYRYNKRKNLSSAIVTVFVLLLLIIPTVFLVSKMISQASSTIKSVSKGSSIYSEFQIDLLSEKLSGLTGMEINLEAYLEYVLTRAGKFILEDKAPALINHAADIIIGVFIMFFIMFYVFRGGRGFYEEIKELIPLKRHYKIKLFSEIENMLHAVLFGQVVTSIVQGVLCGIGLYVAGVPNALFWTFITILIGFIPFIGTPVVFVPASVYLMLHEQVGAGIGLLVYGFIIVMNIDNVIKPKIIGSRANVHPVLVLLGVIGGLKVFGFIGLLVGPIIMSLLIIFLRIYSSEFMHYD